MIKYILQILNKCGHFKTRVYNILSGSYCHMLYLGISGHTGQDIGIGIYSGLFH
jgi:hypothetical protein